MPIEEHELGDDGVAASLLPNFVPPDAPPLPEMADNKPVDLQAAQPSVPELVSKWVVEAWDGSNDASAARELFAKRLREHFELSKQGVTAPPDPALQDDIDKLQAGQGAGIPALVELVIARYESYEAQLKGEPAATADTSAPTSASAPGKDDKTVNVTQLLQEPAEALPAASQEASAARATAQGETEPAVDKQSARVTAVDDLDEIDPEALAAIMATAGQINSAKRAIDPEELERVNAVMQQPPALVQHQPQALIPGAGPTQGAQSVKTGAQALVEGGAALIGGAAALVGAAARGAGKGAAALASVVGGATAEDKAAEATVNLEAGDVPLPTVLPRLSEYRILQAEKQAGAYEQAHESFWQSDKMPIIRKEIEEQARVSGLSVPDVMEKMKPNGELAELHDKFTKALSESPAAQTHKKAMDKALESWSRQYGRAQQELLNPQTDDSPLYQGLKDRLEGSHRRMQGSAATVPVFGDEDKSHLERLRETVAKVMEKLKEVVKSVSNALRGKKSVEAEESVDAPHP